LDAAAIAERARALFQTPWVTESLGLLAVGLAAWLAWLVARRLLVAGIARAAAQSVTHWDDALVEGRVFGRLAMVAPVLVVHRGVELVPGVHEVLLLVIQRVAISFLVVAVALAASGVLSALNVLYASRPENRRRPIKGYVQLLQIAVFVIAGLLVVATLLDRSPWIFLSGLGALAAVLLLVFRDTLLGLVASVQLTGNDMIHVGDWIAMPQYGADGNVIDVALHTVKVQNWDKTITTIPTHRLIEESFVNWRGMQLAGGRRIKRSLYLDLTSIRFLSDEEVERAGRIGVLRDYIQKKKEEIREHNAREGLAPDAVPDQRRLTNVGTLRAYILHYLRHHPSFRQEYTMIVRQLEPTERGLPLEVYAFADRTAWAEYEAIQSDLFDHLLAVLPEFGLRPYQLPSGHDVTSLAASLGGAR